ncbi:TrbI/VirB10 family protein [Agrobacterium tumefaciens]|jgi:type IV secretion system protein VirB10|uniref:TrbI/VirB10 family protein n=1 Tax=Agrobacterium tumefaciens TaxID=358 RepID=A0AA44JAY8_AGRTU|nr:TrbI/VirB10 family protein [Agrobacterium tumefaciens]NTB87874.1 TrbI/VirB10 family protein [Agrobacterium tumefaciens]NTC17062.1 TrbI/VirB10 family protein [Agrobacterium tumefaciens]NTC31121.1 TrbI/VirB10 family protein [Agrobacterium tumefaciens]
MTGTEDQQLDERPDEPPRTEQDIAKELRLRPDPPRAMRLSRKAITVLTVAGGLGIGAILIVALQGSDPGDGPSELFSTERVQEAEGLLGLPRDYASIPQLGPPLPGELGRPVLSAQRRGDPVPVVPATGPAVDPEEQLRLQEAEAARLATLFADARSSGTGAERPQAAPVAAAATGLRGLFPASADQARRPDTTERQEAFLDREVDRRTTAANRLQSPPSPYVLQAGSVIEAALLTGLRSDLPGQITAQVTANVYDSPTGQFLLIPQGARLLGEYDSRVETGQRRLLLAWTRLILPDGSSIVLERQPGTDQAGYAGLEDGVDNHWGQLFRAAGLATILNIGLETGEDGGDEIAEAIRDGTQDTIGRAGEAIVQRQLQIPPTLTIRPGFPVRVMVTRDLILEPQGDAR